jgi:hypothetical protein
LSARSERRLHFTTISVARSNGNFFNGVPSKANERVDRSTADDLSPETIAAQARGVVDTETWLPRICTRVHHSVVARETHRNFGFNLPWWDRLFGTCRDQPAAGHESMTIGIERFREPAEQRLVCLFRERSSVLQAAYSSVRFGERPLTY